MTRLRCVACRSRADLAYGAKDRPYCKPCAEACRAFVVASARRHKPLVYLGV